MNRKLIPTIAAVLLVLCTALAGGVAAQTDTATATPTETTTDDDSFLVTMPANETFTVTNDTEELRAIAENTNGTLSVTVYDVSDGNRTQVATGSLNASGADATDTYTFSAIDAANVTEYELEVTGDGAEHINFEAVGVISGGGGFMDSGYSASMIAVVLGIVGVAGLLYRSERR